MIKLLEFNYLKLLKKFENVKVVELGMGITHTKEVHKGAQGTHSGFWTRGRGEIDNQ